MFASIPAKAYRVVVILVHRAALVLFFAFFQLVGLGLGGLFVVVGQDLGLLGFVEIVALVHLHFVFGHGDSAASTAVRSRNEVVPGLELAGCTLDSCPLLGEVGNKHGAGSSSWADVSPGVDGPAPGPSCWRVSQPLSTPAAQNFQKLSHLSLVPAAPTANGLPTLIEGRYRAIQLQAQLRAVQCL